jgi:hypothetical protein
LDKKGHQGMSRAPYIMWKEARGTENRDAGGLWSIIFCNIYFWPARAISKRMCEGRWKDPATFAFGKMKSAKEKRTWC